jgi:hypothetical protein
VRRLGADLNAIVECEKDGALLLPVSVCGDNRYSCCVSTVGRIPLFLNGTIKDRVSGVLSSIGEDGIAGRKWLNEL